MTVDTHEKTNRDSNYTLGLRIVKSTWATHGYFFLASTHVSIRVGMYCHPGKSGMTASNESPTFFVVHEVSDDERIASAQISDVFFFRRRRAH